MDAIVKQWYEDRKNVDEMKHWENPKLKKWEQYAAGFFPAEANILDIGCGLGREAFVLSDMGYRVTGIDISHEVIRQVTRLSASKGYRIPFHSYDGRTLPFDAASFDAVVLWSQTFGLLYGNDRKAGFLKECKRVLKDEGWMSFSAHDYSYLKTHYADYVKESSFYPYANAEIYWETFTPDELTRYAKAAGYEIELCQTGEIYKPEDGIVLHCLCRKPNGCC